MVSTPGPQGVKHDIQQHPVRSRRNADRCTLDFYLDHRAIIAVKPPAAPAIPTIAPSRLVAAALYNDMYKIFLPHTIAMFFFIVPIIFRMRSMLAYYPQPQFKSKNINEERMAKVAHHEQVAPAQRLL
ncbi:MAG: hypothetical protein CMI63_05630 [Parvularcula sp.]|nr:hypothetical protein [Parvularcula sp.]